jgi:hypothetical protein
MLRNATGARRRRSPRLLAATFLVASLAGCSAGGGGGQQGDTLPDPTAVGTPNGASTTQVIGAAGGTLTSSDGKLLVTVPAWAVGSPTTFSIQPVTNEAYGGVGDAYALGPEGLALAVPATLSFSVPADAATAYAVAFQDGERRWRYVEGAELDATGTILTAPAPHFSIWSAVAGAQLQPATAHVRTSEALQLAAISCMGPRKVTGTHYLYGCRPDPTVVVASSWSVNGAAGGTSTYGTIGGDTGGAEYLSPEKQPPQNTVSASVQLDGDAAESIIWGRVQLVSHITIGCAGPDDPCGIGCATVTWSGEDNPACVYTAFVMDPAMPEGFLKTGGTFNPSLPILYTTISLDVDACVLTMLENPASSCGEGPACTNPGVFDFKTPSCSIGGCYLGMVCQDSPCTFGTSELCGLLAP